MEAEMVRAMYDLACWIRLAPLLNGPFLPMSGWSLRPGGMVKLLDDISLRERSVIVECGSGATTVLLGRMLAQRGQGNVLSLEHDEKWAAWVGNQLAREGLTDVVTVIHAPLREHPAAVDNGEWYAPDTVTDEVTAFTAKHGPIDLLLVDGPPGGELGHKMARYPALPVLREQLAPDASVMLDDVNRSGGPEIAELWAKECGLAMDLDPFGTRAAFGTFRP